MSIVAVEPINDDDTLLRRVHPTQVVEDKNLGGWRPSSGAFTDDELSADSEALLTKYGLNSGFCLQNYNGYSLVGLKAGFARAAGLKVDHTPKIDNPAHVDVTGKKTKGIQRQLAAASAWVHQEPK